ncbi:hypothetical protein EJP617_32680 [Erwinia sp. Ejp617]|nr:hypothetical protein EJP617_32680 [Erwinia sp. Ejp617]
MRSTRVFKIYHSYISPVIAMLTLCAPLPAGIRNNVKNQSD